MKKILREACVETYEQAILAEKYGADRIELCDDLSKGGITPDFQLVKKLLTTLSIPMRVMVRPRGGNFIYSNKELEKMKTDILTFKKIGVEGVVFGILEKNNTINLAQTQELTTLAKPLKVIFHKAIDDTENILKEFYKLLNISTIDAVLTSGGGATASEGATILREMIKLSNNKIEIVAAGKITKENFSNIHQEIGGKAYHGRKIVGVLEV